MRPTLLADPILWTAGWVILNSSWLVMVVWIIHRLFQRLLRNYGPSSLYWSACACLIVLVISCLIMGLVVWSNRPITEWVVSPQQLLVGGYYDLPEVRSQATLSMILRAVGPILGLLAGVWTLGLSLVTLFVLAGWIQLKLTVRSSRQIAVGGLQDYHLLCSQVTPGKQPKVLLNDLILEPGTAGWRSPVILISEAIYEAMPADQLRCILAHELAHIRRSDYFVNLCQTMCDALLFFHPCARWLSRDVRQLREECCDDIAAEVSGGVRKYGEALLALEKVASRQYLLQRASGGSLYDRIERLIRLNKTARRDSPVRVLVGVAAICTVLLATVASLGNITQFARIDAEIARRSAGEIVSGECGLSTAVPNNDLPIEMNAFLRSCPKESTASREQLAPLVGALSKGARGNELLLAQLKEIESRPPTDPLGILSAIPPDMDRWDGVVDQIWNHTASMQDPAERHRWGRAALVLACQESFSWPRLQFLLCDPAAEINLGWTRQQMDCACRIFAQAARHDQSMLDLRNYVSAVRIRQNVHFAEIAPSPHLVFIYVTQTTRGREMSKVLQEIVPFVDDEVIQVIYRLVAAGRLHQFEVHDPVRIFKKK